MASTAQRAGARSNRRTFQPGEGGSQYDHQVLDIARVVRVVKGGRRFRFRATVIVGDRSGSAGVGVAKSRDVQSAIQKAIHQAEKNVIRIPLAEGTIAHEVEAKFNGAHVFLKPARPGTGIIAGGTVRMVVDLAGVTDLVTKTYGSVNKLNNARATLAALGNL